mmetsp:Transcript_10781/g.36234  ORF Transcript_10781/g.36234 Transcript_10781/m.36234 type:complete len:107 (-) Transcript_10781:739-1059(-)
MKQNGRSPRLEQLFAKQRKQYEFRNLLQKYGSASSNLTAILQSRIRSTLYIRSKSARVLQVYQCLRLPLWASCDRFTHVNNSARSDAVHAACTSWAWRALVSFCRR